MNAKRSFFQQGRLFNPATGELLRRGQPIGSCEELGFDDLDIQAEGPPNRPSGHPSTPEVEVRTSERRRKYATAYWQGNKIVVVLPSRMALRERPKMVERLVAQVLATRPNATGSDAYLESRARALADQYVEQVRPSSVRWASTQRRRWGSCNPQTKAIRISTMLRPVPPWVLDAVLVHELAHLLEAGHGPGFKAILSRYEKSQEADLFLAGYGLGLESSLD
jgi:predicted metal-dependent hydrolase